MAIKNRGNGIPTRGGGGSGSGEIAVAVTDNDDANVISSKVKKIIWATDSLGFSATIHPDDEGVVVIGDPPEFLDPINWSSSQTVDVRVSESDAGEADTYLTNGKENATLKGSTGDFSFTSSLGRGFGPDSLLTVKTYHNGVLVDDTSFICGGNGGQSNGNVSISVSGYASDGDGSAFKGQLSVTVDSEGLIGSTNSGVCRVEISFKEQKFETVRSISQDIFKDKNTETPSITGLTEVQEDTDPARRVTKYISGIQYYTIGSPFDITVEGIDNHNEDSSRPSESLVLDTSNFGITSYNTSPWTDGVSWTNFTNLDTVQGIDYAEEKLIDVTNFRHVGDAKIGCIIRDSWNAATSVDTNTLKVCIDTVTNPSTDSVEYFDEENRRLELDYTTAWDNERYLSDGEAVFYGGKMVHGADLPRITESSEGALGTAGSLSASLPNQDNTGSVRQNPNYTGHNRSAVFFRTFPSSGGTKSGFSMNIGANSDVETLLKSGDLKVFIWKSASTNPTTPNAVYPPAHNVVSPSNSEVGSIWLHGTNVYNFGTFTDGAVQDNSNATCRTGVTGTTVSGSFGGNDLDDGAEILVRFEIVKGVTIEEVSVTFT